MEAMEEEIGDLMEEIANETLLGKMIVIAFPCITSNEERGKFIAEGKELQKKMKHLENLAERGKPVIGKSGKELSQTSVATVQANVLRIALMKRDNRRCVLTQTEIASEETENSSTGVASHVLKKVLIEKGKIPENIKNMLNGPYDVRTSILLREDMDKLLNSGKIAIADDRQTVLFSSAKHRDDPELDEQTIKFLAGKPKLRLPDEMSLWPPAEVCKAGREYYQNGYKKRKYNK